MTDSKMTPTINEFANYYEFRGDYDHTPTDGERTMIEDAITGYLEDTGLAARVSTLEAERDRLRRVVNAAWGAFTDADEVGTPLWEALEKEGFVVCREATKADAAEAFAYERGIYPGGRIIELTPAGRAALNPSTGVGEAG